MDYLLAQIRRPSPFLKGFTRFKTYKNHLQQNFIAVQPNEKWVSDISYMHTKQGILYLAVNKDLSDHSIVAKNTFGEGELDRNSVISNFATTAVDGKTYQVDYYNLEVIISNGYRVKSLRGTQFRIWANSILKEYLLKGFAMNDMVKAVYVHAPDKSSGQRKQQIGISYDLVGILPTSLLYDLQNGETA